MSTKRTRPKVTATALSVSVLTLFLVSLSPIPQLLAATTATGSNNLGPAATATLIPVQVSIQTKNLTSVGSYELVAFNSTGAQVASYVGQYSQMTFQLPAGTYLFAANANGPNRAYPPCYVKGAGVTSPPPQAGNPAQGGASSAIAYPCNYSNPPQEYGYSLTKVSGPTTTVNIATQPPSSIPTTPVTVSVSYKNGTAVSNAYVYANVVGAYWYWGGGENTRTTMYAQTGANGVAHLVVPAVPLSVTASKSVPVNIPKSQTTVQVTIGGQVVNVTVYYSPTYVYETASALLLPPATSLSMVVTAQSGYPIIPYASGAASAPGQAAPGAGVLPPNSIQGGGPASQGIPAADVQGSNSASTSTAQLTSIPPIPASAIGASASSSAATSGAPAVNLFAIGTLALAGAIAATVGMVISRTRH